MLDNQYVNPTLVDLYDLESGWSVDRQFYLELAGTDPIRVLDLGCGTGLLCDAYADRGHEVVGVDPAIEMLKVAKYRRNASKIDWVNASAQDFRFEGSFDLIVMTGHAFQVLQDRRAILAALKTIKVHLAPEGRAVFESRNPNIDWKSRWEGARTELIFNGQSVEILKRVVEHSGDYISFEKRYQIGDEVLRSTSKLFFPSCELIADCIASTGLYLAELFGDWDRSGFIPDKSDEMIFVISDGAGAHQ